MSSTYPFPRLAAQEVARMIPNNAMVAFSGFSPAGAAKAVPRAIAAHARQLHAQARRMKLRVLTGASTGESLDDKLAEADAVLWRAPYQSSRAMRDRINRQRVEFVDMHLSSLPQMVDFGFFGKIDFAVVEAVDVLRDGRVYLSTSVGASPTFLRHADKVVIEINRHHSWRLHEMHDIRIMSLPPHRPQTPIGHALEKIGTPFAMVEPARVVGVVETDEPDGVPCFDSPNESCGKIAEHVVRFILREMELGRIPPEFLPLQSGVGDVANAVIYRLGEHPSIPKFEVYGEVLQDAVIKLIEEGRCRGASATSLTLSEPTLARVYANMDFFSPRIVLRPQEISNDPGIVRRLGVISINTVLELDVFGCANSTHVCGTQMVNGIGGSGDFTRNAYLSFLVAPSTAKGGRISTIVPMVSHVDHNEHSVQVVVTEQGLADLRGLGPMERASAIVERCAHPMYRDYLRSYVETAAMGHIRHDLNRSFELHRNLLETGSMLPTATANLAN
jgi:acetyl-CoA hydrolase